MKTFRFLISGILIVAVQSATGLAQPVDVTKTNPMKVYMHYMPWFETPATLGGTNWGYHWKFNNRNPNIVDATGKRQIASHYYPRIGPYASRDADVIEYHMLLMKLSGVDGVMIDWYGVQGTNGDIGNLLTSSNAIIEKVDNFGLKFGVIMEDRFSTVSSGNLTPDINKGRANMAYLRDNYLNNPSYIRRNATADPLVGVFGPIRFQTESQWTQILAEAGEDVDFNTLWYEKNDAGVNADGEYAWIYEDAALNNHLTHQSNFYQLRAPTLGTAGGVAYPGFNDYYEEGGVGQVVPFDIPHNNGQTLNSVRLSATRHVQRLRRRHNVRANY
jgi:glycosyl hydrolase family 99